MADIAYSVLTPMLRRLTRSIGIGGTMQLLRQRGGYRLCVPRDPQRSELTNYLTVAQVQSLIDEFGAGLPITLPKPDKLYLCARNSEIRKEHDAGDSLATLAMRYGLTSRHIANIIAANDDDIETDVATAAQQDLF